LFDGIFKSGSGPFTLMYKQYKTENKAIRLGLTTSFYINSNKDNVSTSNYINSTNADIYLTIGKEFQRQINKWVWYGGGDLQPHYSFNNSSYYSSTVKTATNKNYTLGIGLRPFLGVRYNINSRLYLAAEAGFNLNYNHTRNYYKNENTKIVTQDTKGNNLLLTMSSASGLYIFYRF
jgi:hypothetical protein